MGKPSRFFAVQNYRTRVREDVEAELRVHFDMAVEDLVRAGMSLEEALQEAGRRFGDRERHRRELERAVRTAARPTLRRRIRSLLSVLREVFAPRGRSRHRPF